jgi:hypothetical protein
MGPPFPFQRNRSSVATFAACASFAATPGEKLRILPVRKANISPGGTPAVCAHSVGRKWCKTMKARKASRWALMIWPRGAATSPISTLGFAYREVETRSGSTFSGRALYWEEMARCSGVGFAGDPRIPAERRGRSSSVTGNHYPAATASRRRHPSAASSFLPPIRW